VNVYDSTTMTTC